MSEFTHEKHEVGCSQASGHSRQESHKSLNSIVPIRTALSQLDWLFLDQGYASRYPVHPPSTIPTRGRFPPQPRVSGNAHMTALTAGRRLCYHLESFRLTDADLLTSENSVSWSRGTLEFHSSLAPLFVKRLDGFQRDAAARHDALPLKAGFRIVLLGRPRAAPITYAAAVELILLSGARPKKTVTAALILRACEIVLGLPGSYGLGNAAHCNCRTEDRQSRHLRIPALLEHITEPWKRSMHVIANCIRGRKWTFKRCCVGEV
ncbi:hypothetical protein BU26DRAFT_518214, partial [Trematosphaeria pertusa]